MITRVLLTTFFSGLIVVSTLLLTDHYGFTIKISNYLFWVVTLAVTLKLLTHEKDI